MSLSIFPCGVTHRLGQDTFEHGISENRDTEFWSENTATVCHHTSDFAKISRWPDIQGIDLLNLEWLAECFYFYRR